jgi:phosphatidate cytidylyltransferase
MLKARVITALFLVAGLFGVLFLAPPAGAALAFALVAALAAWEWAGLMRIGGGGRVIYAGVIVASCIAAWNQPEFAYPKLWLAAAAF